MHAHRNVGHVGHIGHDDSGVEGGSWELRDGVDAGLPNGPFPLGGLTLFLDPLLGFLGLLLGKFDLPEGFGVDADVEDHVVLLLVELMDFAPVVGVVNQKQFSLLLVPEVDSSEIGAVVVDGEDVDLEDIGVDFPEDFNKFFLELFFGDSFRFAESLGDQRNEGIILFIMEKEFDLPNWIIDDAFSHLLVYFVGVFNVIKFKESTSLNFVDFLFRVFLDYFLFLGDNRIVLNGWVVGMLSNDHLGDVFGLLLDIGLILFVFVV